MKEKPISETPFGPVELERYELYDESRYSRYGYHFEITRRQFFKALGGGIVVLFFVKDTIDALAQESGNTGNRGRQSGQRFGESTPQELGAWLHIGEDGLITVYTGKVEVGQGSRTSLTQVVAEELHISTDAINAIRLVMSDTDLVPFDMGTFGSRTTPIMVPQLRKVAATARELLVDLAADLWKAERSSVVVADGKITDLNTKQVVDFGRLTKGQRLMKTIGEEAYITPVNQWSIAGKSLQKVNGKEIVTGRHRYASDVKRPNMLYGKILRASTLNANLISIDTSRVGAIAGATVVSDGNFVGVVAPNEHIASEALKAIQAEWKSEPQPSQQELFEYLKKNSSETRGFGGGGGSQHAQGSMEEGLAAAAEKLEQSYTVAYIAHAPLEPRAAVAGWNNDKLTVWTGTQRPFGVRSELSRAFNIPEGQVRVIVPDTGAGYGGKHSGETAIEAAKLAKAADKPVKVVWSREEEFSWAYFRPAGVIDIVSGVKKDGTITAWEFHNYNSGASAIRTMYDIPNQKIEFHASRSPLRQGSYRGLAATANHFARETHMDELAHILKLDPLAFRYKNLKDARLKAAFEAAAEKFGWGKSKTSPNQGFGIAGGFEKGGYIATCAEVLVDPSSKNSSVKVIRVVAAFECGAIINPDNLKNQVEGSIVMGLGGALFEAVEFENGKILNPRFSRYRLPRFSDTPIIEVVLIDRQDLPAAGAGETPIVGIAPAIGNAIFDAAGIRLRSLPMAPNNLI